MSYNRNNPVKNIMRNITPNKRINNTRNKSSEFNSDLIYYYAIMVSIMFKSFAFIPIIADVMEKKYTKNIPYVSLFLFLMSSLILIVISVYKKYYIHFMFFIIMFVACVILIILKTKYDNYNENFTKHGTPSAGPFNTWQQRSKEIKKRGKEIIHHISGA